MTTPMIDEARVAEKAYELWLAEGQPEGKQDEHWYRAIDALTVPVPKKPRRAPAAKVGGPRSRTSPRPRSRSGPARRRPSPDAAPPELTDPTVRSDSAVPSCAS